MKNQIFCLKKLIPTLISICKEYFLMPKVVLARNPRAVCKIKFKPWSGDLGSGFLIVGLQLSSGFQVLGSRSWVQVLDLAPEVLGLLLWIHDHKSQVAGRWSRVTSLVSWVSVFSAVINFHEICPTVI